MRKYIIVSILVLSIMSFNNVAYAKEISTKDYNAIIAILKVFKIEQYKINAISEILRAKNTPCNNGELYNSINGMLCNTPAPAPIINTPPNNTTPKIPTPQTQAPTINNTPPINTPMGFVSA